MEWESGQSILGLPCLSRCRSSHDNDMLALKHALVIWGVWTTSYKIWCLRLVGGKSSPLLKHWRCWGSPYKKHVVFRSPASPPRSNVTVESSIYIYIYKDGNAKQQHAQHHQQDFAPTNDPMLFSLKKGLFDDNYL